MPPEVKRVFLNVPFDRAYEPLFVALVGTLVFLEQNPHCVLEIPETGEGRLVRIFELMRACRTSIHDVSRVGTPVRFNMPFELGLACGMKLSNPGDHEVLVFDKKPYRIDRTLSDYKGRDPLIHHNRPAGVVACLLDVFEAGPSISAALIRRSLEMLAKTMQNLKRELAVNSLFRPALFRFLLSAATDIGINEGLIRR
ncbi:MAG TPA: hypothetical protein VMU84_12490 [Thermoanaerobaculia bacterium]|nr:hypothetical protein [Thermoanaerobaculia bacterium]